MGVNLSAHRKMMRIEFRDLVSATGLPQDVIQKILDANGDYKGDASSRQLETLAKALSLTVGQLVKKPEPPTRLATPRWAASSKPSRQQPAEQRSMRRSPQPRQGTEVLHRTASRI